MNTPAHLLVNLAAFGGEGRARAGWVSFGALLPDLPMFLFFFWEWGVLSTPQGVIWGERYFDPGWQVFFDLFNSIPLFALVLVAGWWRRREALVWLAASALLHCLLDLPVHREDGHRHFYPFSDWRFMSPVSYWDPAHGGVLGSGIETFAILAAGVVIWRRHRHPAARVPTLLLGLLSVAAWVAFYGFGLMPDF